MIAGQPLGQPASAFAQIRMRQMRELVHRRPVRAQLLVARVTSYVEQHRHVAAPRRLPPRHRAAAAALAFAHFHARRTQREAAGRQHGRACGFFRPSLQHRDACGIVDAEHLDAQRALANIYLARVRKCTVRIRAHRDAREGQQRNQADDGCGGCAHGLWISLLQRSSAPKCRGRRCCVGAMQVATLLTVVPTKA